MTMLERFKLLNPNINRIKIKRGAEGVIGWELYDESGALLGYGFYIKVPESSLDVPLAEEFDIYDVTGIVDLDFKVTELNIDRHPDYTGDLWAVDIVEDEFKQQYIGLSSESIGLAPEGKINAISESTLSSKQVTQAIKEKVETLVKFLN